jgi:hypothetical protein
MIGALAGAYSFMNGLPSQLGLSCMAGTLMLTSVGFALFRLAPHATVGVLPGLDGYAMAAASSAGVLCNGRV